jgi:hypothetical protein
MLGLILCCVLSAADVGTPQYASGVGDVLVVDDVRVEKWTISFDSEVKRDGFVTVRVKKKDVEFKSLRFAKKSWREFRFVGLRVVSKETSGEWVTVKLRYRRLY